MEARLTSTTDLALKSGYMSFPMSSLYEPISKAYLHQPPLIRLTEF